MTLGQHFTPAPLARWLVERALEGMSNNTSDALRAVDPACGQGVFLQALSEVCAEREMALDLTGVEIDPIAAGGALHRLGERARIIEADALSLAGSAPLLDGAFDVVALNPPYIGEKGHRALFESVARLGERWKSRCAPRMDYLYFFLHLGLDLLRPGGRMVALTTAYWPSATSANLLRADLARRGVVLRWIAFDGAPIFDGAPGQHNLALIAERAEAAVAGPWLQEHATMSPAGSVISVRSEPDQAPLEGSEPWQPFVSAEVRRRAQADAQAWGTRFIDLAEDRQGVVSGCDRITRRHLATLGHREDLLGSPVFVLSGNEVVARGWDKDPEIAPRLEPLLRGSTITRLDVCASRRRLDDPEGRVLLYLTRNGPPPPEALLTHLRPFRALLSKRREVQEGALPWWALHWPRRLDQMRAPKIVTARRGAAMRFCLDLGGHVVSSDCTIILPKSGVPEDLELLWLTLHTPEVARLMRARGKRKGSLMEFYSEPLRRLSLPIDPADGGLWTSLLPQSLSQVASEVRMPLRHT